MIYLRNYSSHDDYINESKTFPNKPSVIWDNQHIHFINPEEEEETPEESKYKLTVLINNTDFGEISTYEYEYPENNTVNEYINYISIDSSYTVYNADTNEELNDNSPFIVITETEGFTVSGTMPNYNVKINITTTSLA